MEFARFSSYVSPLLKASLVKSALPATSIHCIRQSRRNTPSSTTTTTTPSDATSSSTSRLYFRFNHLMQLKQNDDDLYEILGVKHTSSDNEIRSAYKKLCLKFHPDHNPDGREQFEHIHNAYQILRDPESRRQYDIQQLICPSFKLPRTSTTATSTTASPTTATSHLAKTSPPNRETYEDNRHDIVHTLHCSLEDLYVGRRRKFQIKRKLICESCTRNCGTAVVNCEVCCGKLTCDEKKIFKVLIPPGMNHGQSIVFKGQGDEHYMNNGKPLRLKGNLVFTVKQKPHSIFTRSGNHLFMNHNLTLTEAITGLFSFCVRHLDGRRLKVVADHTLRSGGTRDHHYNHNIRNGQIACIRNEGMPVSESSEERGNLYVKFNIDELEEDLSVVEQIKKMSTTDLFQQQQQQVTSMEFITPLSKVNMDEIRSILPDSFVS